MHDQFLVLEYQQHGSTLNEQRIFGGQRHRYLNTTGRWAAHGTAPNPLLAWNSEKEAEAAAKITSTARGAVILVSSIGGSDLRIGKQLVYYQSQHIGALKGYLPFKSVAAKKLEAERQKTLHYAQAVLSVMSANSAEECEAAVKKANKDLHTLFGGGSFYSAAHYLIGQSGYDIVSRILEGELQPGEKINNDQLVEAVLAAKIYCEAHLEALKNKNPKS